MKHSHKTDGRPSLQFYPDDWISDSSLTMCSLEAQGAWIKLLCHMFRSPERGVLLNANGMRIDADGVARLLAVGVQDAERILCELDTAGVYSKRDDGAIYNRRMYRDECARRAKSNAGRHAAKARWAMRKHGSTTPSPSPSPTPKVKNTCSELGKQAAEPPVLKLELIPKDGHFQITQTMVDQWSKSYPAVDVMGELRKACQWCIDNPTKRKTKRGAKKFLGGWLGRCQDRGGSAKPSLFSGRESSLERIERIRRESHV